ncbi:Cytochrome b2, mitochondrial precursor [Tulasnella sp. 403]|nr:Cytochrome b2, mitochondrial precursor [Tulasnella sp. 403]
MLRPEQHLGAVDPATMPEVDPEWTDDDIRVIIAKKNRPPLGAMITLADIEDVARNVMTKQAWHYYRSDAEDGYSYRNNIAALRHYFFRPRVSLYLAKDRNNSKAVLKKVERLGYNAVMFTVDAPILGRRDFDMRMREVSADDEGNSEKRGGVATTIDGYFEANIGWKDVEWLQRNTKLPIIIKGIQSVEDCLLAVKYPGVKGILLSNHGGRQSDYAPASIDVLYELRTKHPDVFNKVEVYVDGGFRRGTDVVKALCLGAKACGFGRSFLYANAAYGEAGVTKTIRILRDEIVNAMQQIGLKNISEARPEMIKYMDRAIDSPKPSDYSQE